MANPQESQEARALIAQLREARARFSIDQSMSADEIQQALGTLVNAVSRVERASSQASRTGADEMQAVSDAAADIAGELENIDAQPESPDAVNEIEAAVTAAFTQLPKWQ